MRTWLRSPVPTLCGGCNQPIDVGAPCLAIRLGGVLTDRDGQQTATIHVKATKFRCARCAGEAPPELPPLVVNSGPTIRPSAMVNIGPDLLPLDFKKAAGGDR